MEPAVTSQIHKSKQRQTVKKKAEHRGEKRICGAPANFEWWKKFYICLTDQSMPN
jgi:hypothetical protein